MPKTLIFGGSGKVARHLAALLSSSHAVVSIIRNTTQVPSLSALGVTPVVQSIEESSIADLRALIEREAPDNVVWSAGAGGGDPARTWAVDRDGAIRVMDALAQVSPKPRFVMVSAVDVRDHSKPVPEWYGADDRALSGRMWESLATYMAAKLAADTALVEGNAERQLRYTIVRPSRLTEDPAVGRVRAGRVGITEGISREDVAGVVAEVLANERTVGKAFDVVGGGDLIADAVEGAEDTFEGYH